MADNFSYDVFLSHSAKDKARVRRLAERLQQAGLRVWFDEWNLRSGDIIALKVDEGLEQSRVLLLCISPYALGSGWVALERSTAIHRDPSNEGRRFIPLLLANCELPDTLRRYKLVDFREEAETALEELLTACRVEGIEAQPAAKPEPDKQQAKKEPPPTKLPPAQTESLAVLERKLTGHEFGVKSVAISPDGKWAVSGSDDKSVKIWDLETGECQATLEGHKGDVYSVAITPDGKRILSGSDDDTICIWDAANGDLVANWKASEHSVLALVIIANGKHAVSSGAGGDPTLKVWDITTGTCLAVLEGHSGPVRAVAASKDGRRFLSGSYDNTIRLWDRESDYCMATLEGHEGNVNSVVFSSDGRFGVSGSDDTTVKVWHLEYGIRMGKCVGTLEGHQWDVHSVAISPDGALIASTGFIDHTVRLWDWQSGACLQVIKHDEDASPISVAFSPDGSRLVVGTTEGAIYAYRLTGVRPAPSAE